MEAIRSSETSVETRWTTRRHIQEDDTFHNHCRENLKSYWDINVGICYFQLGLTDIFTINSNLGGITTQNATLTVSDIVHKAELEVNEKGGTASAATGTCPPWQTVQSHLAACPCRVPTSGNVLTFEEYCLLGCVTVSLTEVYQGFGGKYWLHFQSQRVN
jgi:hypothetical protein